MKAVLILQHTTSISAEQTSMRNRTPHKTFSKMISLQAKNLESVLLAEPHVAVIVMFFCRTLIRSAKVSCRTLQIAEPKALNSEKDYLAERWNAGSFRICPKSSTISTVHHKKFFRCYNSGSCSEGIKEFLIPRFCRADLGRVFFFLFGSGEF